MLPIAPPTSYEHLARRADPARLSDRARRDEALRPEILRVFEENGRVQGVRKVWRQLGREGFDVARYTVARLMKGMFIQWITRWTPRGATRRRARWTRLRLPAPNMLRAVRGDDLLAPVVAAHEGGEVPAREDQAVVRPQEELPVDAAERAEPSDQGMFQSGAGRSGLA